MTEEQRLTLLTPPEATVRAVIDTDTFNEVDDQFAVAHALLSPDRITVEAIYAAPFLNQRSLSPGDGMEKSYEEILRILELMNVSSEGFVYRGSEAFLASETRAVESDAAHDLVRRAREAEGPLYVIALAALTNVASALLMAPEIIHKLVVVWLGGNALYWPDNREFNLKQERSATRVVLESKVPLVLVPCMGVTSHLRTTVPELERYIGDAASLLGRFLVDRFKAYKSDHLGWSKEIWDLAPVAYLLDANWTPSELVSTPHLKDDLSWQPTSNRHKMRLVTYVDRDPIFRDLFSKL